MTGAKPVFDMTGATPIEAIQPQQSAAALKATVNPTSLFEGVNPDTIARIKSIIGKEEESKMQVASYMSRSQNVPFKAVMSEYDAFAAQSGFEGNNATAHYTFLVNKLGKQWQHIKKTEEIIGAKSLWGSAWPTSTPLPAMSGYVGGGQGLREHCYRQPSQTCAQTSSYFLSLAELSLTYWRQKRVELRFFMEPSCLGLID